MFTILVALATGEQALTFTGVTTLFAREAVGGALLGFLAGYVAYRAMRAIDEHNLEVMITLSLVMGTYALASIIHVSGPIAMVVAGLLIGQSRDTVRDERGHARSRREVLVAAR